MRSKSSHNVGTCLYLAMTMSLYLCTSEALGSQPNISDNEKTQSREVDSTVTITDST